MGEKSSFFRDDTGKLSMVRLLSFFSFFAACGAGFMTLTIPASYGVTGAGVYLTSIFVLGAFAPKVLQKIPEMNAFKKGQ